MPVPLPNPVPNPPPSALPSNVIPLRPSGGPNLVLLEPAAPAAAPVAAAAPAAGAAVAEGAGGLGLGALVPALLLAIPQVLLLDSPTAKTPYEAQFDVPEPLIEIEPPQLPFEGGQSLGVYHIVGTATVSYSRYFEFETPPQGRPFLIQFSYDTRISGDPIPGKIRGIDPRFGSGLVFGGSNGPRGLMILSSNRPTDPFYVPPYKTTVLVEGKGPFDYGRMTYNEIASAKITQVIPVDGQPDTGGDPEPTAPPIYSTPSTPVVPPQIAPPTSAPPPAVLPTPTTPISPNETPLRREPVAPLLISTPQIPTPTIAQPPLIGQPTPIPIEQFNPLPFDEFAPGRGLNLVPPPYAEPTPPPAPTANPTLNKLPAPTILIQPGANPGPLTFTPNPSTGNPTPIPTTTPTPTPERSPDPQRPLLDDIGKILGPIGIGIAGLTALLKPVPGQLEEIKDRTSPQALQDASKAATCDTMQPGGCSFNAINKATGSLFDRLMQALGAGADLNSLALLKPIKKELELVSTKLGPLMEGANGISGFLGRLSSSLGVDRALNLIAIASNLHNAMMLSANLKITLLEMLSSVGNATGLLQTSEGENVDLNQVFNAGIEAFLIKILGVDSYAGLKVGLRKYNAIYQAATNSLNAVSSMFNSIGNVIEQGAENTGRIGNALKGAGAVSEKAYQWMSEKFDAKTSKFIKFQSTVGNVTQALETINEIAQSVVEGQQAATEFQKANKDFVEAVKNAEKVDGIENKAIKEEAAKAKENATKDPTGEIETGLLSYLTN